MTGDVGALCYHVNTGEEVVAGQLKHLNHFSCLVLLYATPESITAPVSFASARDLLSQISLDIVFGVNEITHVSRPGNVSPVSHSFRSKQRIPSGFCEQALSFH